MREQRDFIDVYWLYRLQLVFALSIVGMAPNRAEACSLPDSVPGVAGVKFYTDASGSIPDAALEKSNQLALAPISDFMAGLEQFLDSEGVTEAELLCVRSSLGKWALGRALLEKPPGTQARVNRVFLAAGFNFLALKLRMRGVDPDPATVRWLTELTHSVDEDYRNFSGNLYVWTGVASGLLVLLSRDEPANLHQVEVWNKSVMAIRADGFIDQELERASRATIYHATNLGALLILHQIRSALGLPLQGSEAVSLHALASATGRALCEPDVISRVSGANQERMGDWGFRIPYAFSGGFLSEDWFRCGTQPRTFTAVNTGGDTRVCARAIASASRRP